MSQLALRLDDQDFLDLVKDIVSLNRAAPEIATTICNHILEHCGGHLYPTLRFIELFFLKPELQKYAVTFEGFFVYFHSSEFSKCSNLGAIIRRCFTSAGNAALSASKLLNSTYTDVDTDLLERVGWLDKDNWKLVSKLLETYCLKIKAQTSPTSSRLQLLLSEDPFNNVKRVIIEGFSKMAETDLTVIETSYAPIENALSFNWAKHVRSSFTNIHIETQVSSNSGWVDNYVDGYCDHAVKFIRNATLKMCVKHLNRFLSGKYYWKNFVIINFAMNSTNVVLPSDSKYRNIFFTYVHLTNTLYQGANAIKSPATSMASRRKILKKSTKSFTKL